MDRLYLNTHFLSDGTFVVVLILWLCKDVVVVGSVTTPVELLLHGFMLSLLGKASQLSSLKFINVIGFVTFGDVFVNDEDMVKSLLICL